MDYLQAYSKQFGLDDITEFDTSVEKLIELPQQTGWKVLTKKVVLANLQDKVGGERKVIRTSWKEEVSNYMNKSYFGGIKKWAVD